MGRRQQSLHQGVAKETDEADVVAATMSKPGVVLKRPAGSSGRFAEHSELPSGLDDAEFRHGRAKRPPKPKKRASPKIGEAEARKAAQEFEKEERRREAECRREEAAQAKQREKRERAVALAQAALDKGEGEHDEKVAALEAEREAVDGRLQTEEARWERESEKLKAALRRARE
ncbi:cell envelope biogenesis protein TolA [Bradyrhizobium sp. SSUT77]|uniref:cell envelope biogenesis protein TolA n=1 Tax=unclassified Bradyrhizobium TaxID=2631580 RepID=UPI0032652386